MRIPVMKVSQERQKLKSPSKKNFLRLSVLVAGAALASAFTVPGCPDMNALQQQVATLQTQVDSLGKRNTELANQFKTVNDEHNTMKQLVSQVSEAALGQKAQLEALQTEVKAMNEKLAKAPAPRSMPAKPAPKPMSRPLPPVKKRR